MYVSNIPDSQPGTSPKPYQVTTEEDVVPTIPSHPGGALKHPDNSRGGNAEHPSHLDYGVHIENVDISEPNHKVHTDTPRKDDTDTIGSNDSSGGRSKVDPSGGNYYNYYTSESDVDRELEGDSGDVHDSSDYTDRGHAGGRDHISSVTRQGTTTVYSLYCNCVQVYIKCT